MLVHVEKKLRVRYSSPVRDCVRRLRVLPPEQIPGQIVREAQWHIFPDPAEASESSDGFGNRILALRHAHIEREFLFSLSLTVEKQQDQERAVALPETGIGAFLLPSALCDLSQSIQTAAAPFRALPLTEKPAAMCEWAHHALRYQPNTSVIETTASQALMQRAGVCQDYAHLMIALCRACALPARYVSGYAPGEGRMHAWVEVMIDNAWQAWDPTHNRVAKPESIVVAIGRDFRDANPHEGTFQGRARATLQTWCKTRQFGFTS